MPPPYVAKVKIVDNANPPTLAPWQTNSRFTEIIAPQQAPDPPRYGDVPSRKARIQRYSVLAKAQIRAVMHDGQAGVIRKTEFEQITSAPQGKSLTWDRRSNIRKTYPEPYGNRFSVLPQAPDESYLRALMGI